MTGRWSERNDPPPSPVGEFFLAVAFALVVTIVALAKVWGWW